MPGLTPPPADNGRERPSIRETIPLPNSRKYPNLTTMPNEPLPKLRWYQYRLRTLLLLVTAFAVCMSWFTVKQKQAERQHKIISEITASGIIVVHYDFEVDESWQETNSEPIVPAWLRKLLGDDFFANVVAIDVRDYRGTEAKNFEHISELTSLKFLSLSGAPLSNEEFKDLNLGKLIHLKSFGIHNDELTDSDLEFLENYSQLEDLSLMDAKLTDEGLKHLSPLKNLRSLCIRFTKIKGTGFAHLKKLTRLRELYIDSESITDKGMEEIADLKTLNVLQICDSNITDAGLDCIKKLTCLKELCIQSNQTIEQGMNRLKKALPNTKILD
jgi:hypothetical protein